jgi:hypothetical protein
MYGEPYDLRCRWSGDLLINTDGRLNALRVITKSVLAVDPLTQELIDWHNQYLIHPLENEIPVSPGQTISISLDYAAGAPLSAFAPVVTV